MTEEIALFPLGLVLFPQGRLSLRIFEQRYLDMVRDCTRLGQPFGVVAVLEQGEERVVAEVGCTARIVDFDTLPDGLLGIQCQGEQRFHVRSTRAAENGLLIGAIDTLPAWPEMEIPAEFQLLAKLVEHVAEQKEKPFGSYRQSDIDNSAWTASRLAEILPLENHERQQLLEEPDVLKRLKFLTEVLPRFQSE